MVSKLGHVEFHAASRLAKFGGCYKCRSYKYDQLRRQMPDFFVTYRCFSVGILLYAQRLLAAAIKVWWSML